MSNICPALKSNYIMRLLIGLALVATVLCLCPAGLSAQTDMATTDITELADFDAANVLFRGLRLGMSKAEVIEKLKGFTDWTSYFDKYNTRSESPTSAKQMRIYVNLKNKAGVDDQ